MYRNYSILISGFINSLLGFVNTFYTFINHYKMVHKLIFIKKYIQSANNKKVNEMFFINWQY